MINATHSMKDPIEMKLVCSACSFGSFLRRKEHSISENFRIYQMRFRLGKIVLVESLSWASLQGAVDWINSGQ